MTPWLDDGDVAVYHGDCLDVLAAMDEASVDAVVCDPPYGLEFMGKEWDGANGFRRSLNPADVMRDDLFGRASRTSPEYRAGHTFQAWCEAWGRAALRVLKPGGYLVAAGGSRTYHRLTCGLEDAGFEIRDCLTWLHGSGFPKSLNVSEALRRLPSCACDVAFGTREDSGRHPTKCNTCGGVRGEILDGFGTALKPAAEFLVVARKPLAGTVAANVLEHGTGALNIDGCRVHSAGSEGGPYKVKRLKPGATLNKTGGSWRPTDDAELPWDPGREYHGETKDGRWPANVVLDEQAAGMLDEQTGERPSGARREGSYGGIGSGAIYGDGGATTLPAIAANSGGPSRYFYTAKADAHERRGSKHPTVKPLDLMRWLVRLVTPPGGLVLDPFAGSGTTLEAARAEGFRAVGIEREAEYLPDIARRLQQLSLLGGAA